MARNERVLGDAIEPVILFDAECVLCSAGAQFVLKHDTVGRFRLASVQSPAGADICRRHGVDPSDPSTMLLIAGDRVRRESDAVIGICVALGWPWRLFAVLRILPAFVRDPVYLWVARHRYRLFGKRASCWVAPPAYRDRIL